MSDIERVGAAPRIDGDQGRPATDTPADRVDLAQSGNGNGPRPASGWVDSRTGALSALHAALNPNVPVVARWRYALGSALVASLAVEIVTGLLLMCSYSPSVATAWGSTFYIDRLVAGGWFLRGMHNFAAHAMIVVAALHLLGVVVAGVYRSPRELNWWLGMGMLGLIIAFTLTGNALVWDQDGYWAWHVETGIAGGVPVVGPYLQRLIVGGSDLGNATLARLYTIHVGLLPSVVLFLLWAHVAQARRHALTRPSGAPVPTVPAWPSQWFANAVATTLMLGTVAGLVLYYGGASLEAPADAASQYPARPAWFFFWLFELRKSFLGPREVIATMVIPGALTTVMLLLPFFDRVFPRKFAHFLACAFAFTVLGAAGFMTVQSLRADGGDPHFRAALAEAEEAKARAVRLAADGIPPEGAAALLGRDPLFHGQAVLREKCLSCHVYDGKGVGTQVAPDLKDFGTRAWVRGLLEKPDAPAYFGKTPGCDGMAEWKQSSKLKAKQLDAVADFVAGFAAIPDDVTPEEWLNSPGVSDHPGLEPFQKECGTCHAVEGLSEGGTRDAPKLFAYASPGWTARFIRKPEAPDLYGYLEKAHRMPGFAGQLTPNDLQAVVRYLRNDYPGASKPPAPR